MCGKPPSFKALKAVFEAELRRLTGREPAATACSTAARAAALATGEKVELFLLLTRCAGTVEPAEKVWEWERL